MHLNNFDLIDYTNEILKNCLALQGQNIIPDTLLPICKTA